MNSEYVNEFGYVSGVFNPVDEEQTELTDQVSRALYGSYLAREISSNKDDKIEIED